LKQSGEEQIKKDLEGWFSNFGFLRSRDKKVFKATEHYWLTKALIAQVLEEHGTQHKELLDKFMLLEAKFEVVCRVVFGIKIEVADWQANDEDCAMNSQGTSFNPVIIEEATKQDINKVAPDFQAPMPPSPLRQD
jgi:hypothetical protein